MVAGVCGGSCPGRREGRERIQEKTKERSRTKKPPCQWPTCFYLSPPPNKAILLWVHQEMNPFIGQSPHNLIISLNVLTDTLRDTLYQSPRHFSLQSSWQSRLIITLEGDLRPHEKHTGFQMQISNMGRMLNHASEISTSRPETWGNYGQKQKGVDCKGVLYKQPQAVLCTGHLQYSQLPAEGFYSPSNMVHSLREHVLFIFVLIPPVSATSTY